MINSNVYDYVNVLDKALDAASLRNQALANNLANATTPGYKRQDVSFETELGKALGHNRFKSMDEKVGNVELGRLKPRTYTDYAGYSYRVDGNNVDPDTEGVELAANQIKYNGLMAAVNQEFANLKLVTK
ncbi:MAG: flagellar basal body rod protein FlgB [Lachnospiraceae bacterium]|nr:flagellar basal body rod protein FlgB [Lachnospiraceae bacterium]